MSSLLKIILIIVIVNTFIRPFPLGAFIKVTKVIFNRTVPLQGIGKSFGGYLKKNTYLDSKFGLYSSAELDQIKKKPQFFDIAANLQSEKFQGIYNGKPQHAPDLEHVFKRASQHEVDRLLVTAGNQEEQKVAYNMVKETPNRWTTVGIHPLRSSEVKDIPKTFEQMDQNIKQYGNKCAAIGECGQDYYRPEFASIKTQKEVFKPHFDLAKKHDLPMYFHSRETGMDFVQTIKENRHMFPTGVVHSFTGTERELNQIIDMDQSVGVNGCSLKTAENLKNVKKIPQDRLMLETDCPYCEIGKTYAGSEYVKTQFPGAKGYKKFEEGEMVKGRNEPAKIVQVADVVSALKGVSKDELAVITYDNASKMFARGI